MNPATGGQAFPVRTTQTGRACRPCFTLGAPVTSPSAPSPAFPLARAAILLAVTLLAAGVGCESSSPEPRPVPPPRVAAPPPVESLDRAVDVMAQYLVKELPSLPEVQNSPHKLVLALGPIENQTQAPPERYRAALVSLQSKVRDSAEIRRNFVIIQTDYADGQETLDRFQPGNRDFDDAFGTGPSKGDVAKYDPDTLYVLTGRFFQARDVDGERVSYRLFVQVENPRSRAQLLSKEFRVVLRWNGKDYRWEPVDPA